MSLTATEFRLYVDVQLVGTIPVSIDFDQVNQQDLFLGVMGPKSSPVLGITNWYPLKGALDDVRVFNRAITLQEIGTLYFSDEAGSCTPAVSVLPAQNQTICESQPLALKSVPLASDVQLQWLKNSQPIAQATLDSLVVSQVGSYRLEATRRTATWKHAMQGLDKTLNDVQLLGTSGWIVGEYGTLLKTTTGGTSWDTIPMNREDTFYSVHFIDSQTGWIGGANGLLLKSTDGGLSWGQQYIPIVSDVEEIQFLNQDVGYARGNGAFYKTTDGGNNWSTVPLPNSPSGKFMFADADVGWIILGKSIYKTQNGGASWNLQKTVSQSSILGSIYALDRNTVWATYYDSQNPSAVTKTTNGGLTWTETNFPVPGTFPTLSYIFVSDLTFIDAQNGFVIGSMYKRVLSSYGVNSAGIFQTKDGGNTWTLIYDNQFNVDPKAISFAGSSRGAIVGSGGLYINATIPVAPTRTYLPLKSVGGTAQKVMAVGGKFKSYEAGAHPDSKAVTVTSPTGDAWTKTETGYSGNGGGGGYTLSQIKFKNSQFGWRVGYFTLSTTHDGGDTWQSVLAPGPPTSFNYIIEKAYFTGDTTGFCLLRTATENSATGLVAFSGATFTAPPVTYKDAGDPANTGMIDLQFIDNRTGFITTSNGKLIKTTNGGTSWSVQLVRANTRLNRCFFVTAQIGWVVGENGLILKTTNGGQNWTTQTSGQLVSWNGIHFLSAQEGYIAGNNGVLIKTSDGGSSWITVVTNTRQNLNDITFTTPDKGFVVGDFGTILAFNPTLLPTCKATSAPVNITVTSGTVCETAASGTWTNLSTWSCGHIPMVCDQIVVNPGHVVTLSQSVQVRGIEIRQNGQLSVQGGNVLLQN